MSKAIKLLIVTLFIAIPFLKISAQTGSISLQVLNLNAVDFAAFAFEKNLKNQPRIFQVIIQTTPPNAMVYVKGEVKWMGNSGTSGGIIVSFSTEKFEARNFSNDEIDASEIKLASGTKYNSDLLKDNINTGKPAGTYKISVELYSASGVKLGNDEKELVFLNPTEPTIVSPFEGSSNDVGAILIQWTNSVGASSYRVLANYLASGQSREEALSSSNLLVNNKDVGNTTSVNIRDILDRELLSDTTIVLVVNAVVPASGGENLLSSPIITFRTTFGGVSQNKSVEVDPTILQLADLLDGKVSANFIESLKNGEIPVDQIQITDDQNNTVSFSDLLSLLSYLNTNSQSLISIKYQAQ
jgi:hypothetical protein